MKDIFKMNRYESLTNARPKLVQLVYNSAKLEGLNVSFAETESIVYNKIINNMKLFDADVIYNLKKAYQYILEAKNVNETSDLTILIQLNKLLGRINDEDRDLWYLPGSLRKNEVKISGSNWNPPLPNLEDIKIELANIQNNTKISETEIALDLFAYIAKSQIFNDGNKRTATLFANHYLLAKGRGLLMIDEEHSTKVKELLVKHYDGTSSSILKTYLYNNCIFGMDNKRVE